MSIACANCECPLRESDAYCGACGQRVLGPDSRSFLHLFRASVAEITSLDSRLWRSLGYLLFRPGYLTCEYIAGRRQRYLSPIGLFLLANVIFFLAPSLSDFSLSLGDQSTQQPYSAWIAPWLDGVAARTGQSFEALAQAYQLRISELAKAMVIIHIPLLALAGYLLAADKRFYYADHVVSALHFFAFLMLYYTLVPIMIVPVLQGIDWMFPMDLPVWQIAVSLQFLYVPFMLRSAFAFGWLRAVLTAIVYLVALYWIHVCYRLAQLLIGVWSVS